MNLRHVVWKDARREMRGKDGIQAGLVLVGLFFVVFVFAQEDVSSDSSFATVVLWLPCVFAAAAVAGRGFAAEVDRGTLDLLRSAPLPLVVHGVSRTLLDLAVGSVVLVATVGLATVLFGIPLDARLVILLGVALLGVILVGSLAGALASQARSRELLLPVLMIPLLSPLLLAGVRATVGLLDRSSVQTWEPALWMIAGYDLVMAGLAWLVWPIVLEGD